MWLHRSSAYNALLSGLILPSPSRKWATGLNTSPLEWPLGGIRQVVPVVLIALSQ